MKILLVHPGASVSTSDVYGGLNDGLVDLGHTVIRYSLDGRITRSAEFLQFLWHKEKRIARKAGLPEPSRPSGLDIAYLAGQGVLERAARFQPDWVVIVSGMYLLREWIRLLKNVRFRVALVCTESPYDDAPHEELLPEVTCCWTNERSSVERLSARCDHVWYLPHAWSHGRLWPQPPYDGEVLAHDVVFVGTLFQERFELLAGVDWSGIDLGLYGEMDLIPDGHSLGQYVCGGYTSPAQCAALYRKAKIGLNMYRASMGFGEGAPWILHAESLNPRAYELAAAGCFSISQYRAEIPEIFGFNLVPTFGRDPKELERLIREWLPREDARAWAKVELPKAVEAHNWDARARQVVDNLATLTPDLVSSGLALAR